MTPVLLVVVVAGVLAPSTAALATTPSYANCTAYQKTFPHGVGKKAAKDRTSGTPVTTFRRDDAEYARAMGKRPDLDRDKDGIACEKR
ncbi:MAG: calcium-binding protein [Frankiales bacterium]|nr:calcium-binding protein [Frankiales bacterium]